MEPISRRDAGKILLAGYAGLLVDGREAWGSATRNQQAQQLPAPASQPAKRSAASNATDAPRSGHDNRASGTAAPDWSDVVVVETPAPTVSYRTGWVTYEESLIAGHFVGRGWNGAGFINFYDGRLNPAEYRAPEAFRLEIDGQSLATDWKWGGLEKTDSLQMATLTRLSL